MWLTNYPILCEVFKLVGTVAGCAGMLAVFALVPCCRQYPRPNPEPSLLSQCCLTLGWLSYPLLLARTGFSGQDTAGTSGLAQTLHHPARASSASVLLPCQETQIYLTTGMHLKRFYAWAAAVLSHSLSCLEHMSTSEG